MDKINVILAGIRKAFSKEGLTYGGIMVKEGIITAIAMMLMLPQILTPMFAQLIHGEDYFFEDWSAEQTFTRDYAYEIEKDPNKDFVILNITDVQLNNCDAYGPKGKLATSIINELVEECKPDLITMTGDNAWCTSAYLKIIKDLDATGIPWAPVMGNHDGQGIPSEFWAAYLMANAKNSLFKMGPKDMGYGNYIINVTENGHIVHTLFMMDTHDNVPKEGNINGTGSSYDHLWENQIAWYEWAVKGIAAIEGKTVESSVYFHIPPFEAREAFTTLLDEPTSWGETREGIYSPDACNGFFELCKELGSTKNMIFGHDHSNNASAVMDGIRLTYGLKCGSGCYWEEDMSGGTTITVSSDGSAVVEHHYSDLKEDTSIWY